LTLSANIGEEEPACDIETEAGCCTSKPSSRNFLYRCRLRRALEKEEKWNPYQMEQLGLIIIIIKL
jgi:hypothetical protein